MRRCKDCVQHDFVPGRLIGLTPAQGSDYVPAHSLIILTH